jgi:hypothetical protein
MVITRVVTEVRVGPFTLTTRRLQTCGKAPCGIAFRRICMNSKQSALASSQVSFGLECC